MWIYTKVADLRLKLKNDFGFSRNWVQRMENWVLTSLAKSRTEVKKRLIKKLKILRENKSKEQKKVKPAPKLNVDKRWCTITVLSN